MLIRLIRNMPCGAAITGVMYIETEIVAGQLDYSMAMDSLEHNDYAIPDGFYRLRMTYSRAFEEVLPILDGVIGYRQAKGDKQEARRQGIRIHAGNTIDDTRGCILVGDKDPLRMRLLSSRKRLNELKDYLLNYLKENPHEEIYIDISSSNPNPFADHFDHSEA